MQRKISIIAFLTIFISTGSSQNIFPILGGQRVGTSVFSFLNIGVSARAVGMGEAVVALDQDAASVYYNPATIAQFDRIELTATQIQWPVDINYDYFSVSGHLKGRHYIGMSGGILHMAPMMETTEYLPDGTGNYFTFQDRFIALTYGAKMTDRFSFGITLKHVSEDLADYGMSTILMDIGTFYWTGFKTLRFCAALTHFGGQTGPNGYYDKKILDQGSGEEITESTEYNIFSPPTMFRVGLAIDPVITNNHHVVIAMQLNHPVDNAEYIVTGFEYSYLKLLYFRSGLKINKRGEGLTFGVGLNVPVRNIIVRADYGYADFQQLSDPKRFSIGVTFR